MICNLQHKIYYVALELNEVDARDYPLQFNKYLIKIGLSNKTIRQYMFYAYKLDMTTKWKPSIVDKFLDEALLQANSTYRTKMVMLRHWVNCFNLEKIANPKLKRYVRKGKTPFTLGKPKAFKQNEVSTLIKKAEDKELYFILKLISETGMRIGTLLNMTRKDRDGVNKKEGVYVYKVLSKHNITYQIYPSIATIDALNRYTYTIKKKLLEDGLKRKRNLHYYNRLDEGFFFTRSEDTYRRRFKQLCKDNGIVLEVGEGFHKLRHYFGNEIGKLIPNLKTRATILGQKNAISSSIYSSHEEQEYFDIKKKLPKI